MRIAIIGQEEPVYFGPFLRSIITARHNDIVLVVIAGSRGAGSHPKTLSQKIKNIYSLWLIMEPMGFLRNALIAFWQKALMTLGLIGSFLDKRSIRGAAMGFNIPLIYAHDLNSPDLIEKLRSADCDIVVNQSEMLFKKELLSVAKIGVINRHASLLPRYRGRLGSWWSHAGSPAEYGVTIHFVNDQIDAGPIILQREFKIDPSSSYTKVLDMLFKESIPLMQEALMKIENKDFVAARCDYQGTRTYLFPTLRDVKTYRRDLTRRRKGEML